MNHVDIQFDCLPLRSIPRTDIPWDAPPDARARYQRVLDAVAKHGLHNTYYLHDARCTFHMTNDAQVGGIEFTFEGTLLTDEEDCRTRGADLEIQLGCETCDWLNQAAVAWLTESVRRAVIVEFDRFIASGDLERTKQRIQRMQAASDASGGFLGMGL